jgi:subtilisin family serine protease
MEKKNRDFQWKTRKKLTQTRQHTRFQGAKITSNSWGGGGFSRALYDEIKISEGEGGLFIAAAGNEGQDIDSRPTYPVSVNSVDSVDSVNSMSSCCAECCAVLCCSAALLLCCSCPE